MPETQRVYIAHEALSRGLRVIGTVRSKDKGDYLVRVLQNNRFSFVVVEDVEKAEVFDEHVKEVDYICHTASPFHYKYKDPQTELIDPALNGTLSVFRAAHSYGKKVRRIVVTASNACLFNPHPPPYVFTARDWNTYSPEEFKKGTAKPIDCYRTSKVLAERAAWDFIKENKTSFDMVAINPPFVWGPIRHQVKSVDAINTSVASIYQLLSGKTQPPDAEKSFASNAGMMCDVRDVAYAHVEALLNQKAGGHRFPLSTTPWSQQDLLDVVHEPGLIEKVQEVFPSVPKGTPGASKGLHAGWNSLDQTDCKEILHLKFTPFEKTIRDTVEMLILREESNWTLEPSFQGM